MSLFLTRRSSNVEGGSTRTSLTAAIPLPEWTFMITSQHIRTGFAVAVAALILATSAAIPASAKSVPSLEVEASLDHAYASASVTIRDLGTQSHLQWKLVGPMPTVNGSCYPVDWSTAPDFDAGFTQVAGNSVVPIPQTHVGAAGCYSYRLVLWETPTTEAVVFAAGSATVLYAPAGPTVNYPIDRGIVTLASQAAPGSPVATLQETGQTYAYHPEARNVVASPGSWAIPEQRWRLIQTGADTYRFLNVNSGRALQATNDSTDLPLHDTTDPAYAGPRFNVVTTPASWNIGQQQIRVARVPGGDGSTVTLWGKVGSAEQRIEVTPIGYLNIPGVYLVGTGPASVPWTVSGYTFPR